ERPLVGRQVFSLQVLPNGGIVPRIRHAAVRGAVGHHVVHTLRFGRGLDDPPRPSLQGRSLLDRLVDRRRRTAEGLGQPVLTRERLALAAEPFHPLRRLPPGHTRWFGPPRAAPGVRGDPPPKTLDQRHQVGQRAGFAHVFTFERCRRGVG